MSVSVSSSSMASGFYRQNQPGMQCSPMVASSPRQSRPRFGYHAQSPYPRPMSSGSKVDNGVPYSPVPEEPAYDSFYRQTKSSSTPVGRPGYSWERLQSSGASNEGRVAGYSDNASQQSMHSPNFVNNYPQRNSAGYTGNSSFMSDDGNSSYATCPEMSYRSDQSFDASSGRSESSPYSNNFSNSRPYAGGFGTPYRGGPSPKKFTSSMEWQQPTQQQPLPSQEMSPFMAPPPPPQQQQFGQTVNKAPFRRFPQKRKAEPQQAKHCDICNIDFTSQIPYEMHLRGAKHLKKLKAEETLKMLQSQGFAKPTDTATKAFHCEVCDLTLNGALQLQTHYEGAKHKNKVAAAAAAEGGGSRDPNTADKQEGKPAVSEAEQNGKEPAKASAPQQQPPPPAAITGPVKAISEPTPAKMAKFSCEICSINVNSQVQLQQHLESKKHQAKLEGKTYTRKKWRKKPGNSSTDLTAEQGNVAAEGSAQKPEVTEVVHAVPPLTATFVKSDVLT